MVWYLREQNSMKLVNHRQEKVNATIAFGCNAAELYITSLINLKNLYTLELVSELVCDKISNSG